MHELRPYQSAAIQGARDAWPKRPVIVCPTGSGKSVIGAEIVNRIRERVDWIVHRRELVYQAADHIGECGLILAGEKRHDKRAMVASIQTLARRDATGARFAIVDEAHHSVSASYRKVLSRYDYVLGLTATPIRLDGKGLGSVFDVLVEPATTADLIRDGWLAGFDYYAPSEPDMVGARKTGGDWTKKDASERMRKPKITGSILEHYKQYGRGVPTLVFAPSVEYSRYLASLLGGEHVDAKTPKSERERIFTCLREGTLPLVSNVEIVTEGFDAPGVGCVILARPTASLGLHRQMIGRALRPGKRAVILDHAGNVYRHGLPDETIPWSLADTKLEPRTKQIRTCAECYAIFEKSERKCPRCGSDPAPPRKPRKGPGSRGGKLERINAAMLKRRMAGERGALYRDLLQEAMESGYKPGWAKAQFKNKTGYWPSGGGDLADAKESCTHERAEEGRCRFCGASTITQPTSAPTS